MAFFFYSFSVVPPSIAGYLQVPENVSIVEKNPISLVCEASGIPLPSITWLKNGWPVTLNNSVRILSGTKVVVIWGEKTNPNQGRAPCIYSAGISHERTFGLVICKDMRGEKLLLNGKLFSKRGQVPWSYK